MSKASKIRTIILEVLSDGCPHKSDELRALIIERGIDLSSGYGSIWSTIHQMKKKQEITPTAVGEYQLTNPPQLLTYSLNELENINQELRSISKRLRDTAHEISTFNWIDCNDLELTEMRDKAKLVKQIVNQITQLNNLETNL